MKPGESALMVGAIAAAILGWLLFGVMFLNEMSILEQCEKSGMATVRKTAITCTVQPNAKVVYPESKPHLELSK